MLEHFGRHAYKAVLAEWYRVLGSGGVLRLAVPDFEACAALYCRGQLTALSDIVGLVCGGQHDQYDYHKMIFDDRSLSRDLRAVGFLEVRHWDWRKTEHAIVDDYSQAYLPHLDKEQGTLVSLNLEAIKLWSVPFNRGAGKCGFACHLGRFRGAERIFQRTSTSLLRFMARVCDC